MLHHVETLRVGSDGPAARTQTSTAPATRRTADLWHKSRKPDTALPKGHQRKGPCTAILSIHQTNLQRNPRQYYRTPQDVTLQHNHAWHIREPYCSPLCANDCLCPPPPRLPATIHANDSGEAPIHRSTMLPLQLIALAVVVLAPRPAAGAAGIVLQLKSLTSCHRTTHRHTQAEHLLTTHRHINNCAYNSMCLDFTSQHCASPHRLSVNKPA
jgi:hypothetical protein